MNISKIIATLAALSLAAAASAQSFVSVPLTKDGFSTIHVSKYEKGNYQGMDCYKDYIFSCKHTGIATVWKYNGEGIEKLGSFNLATHDEVNHSNVASFGCEF